MNGKSVYLMKRTIQLLFLVLIAISCSSETDDLIKGTHAFRIDSIEITAKGSGLAQKGLEPSIALVSINDQKGNAVYTRERIALTKEGDSYITSEISLDVGTYTLVEFIVADANDILISLFPKENSDLAQFVSNPLPMDFTVSSEETKVTQTENIDAAGFTPINFGYTRLSLIVPESTDSFSITVDDSDSTTTKLLDIKSITGSTYTIDWGDGTIEEYVSTKMGWITESLSHDYVQNGVYTITVSGAIEAIELIEFGSDEGNGYESHLTEIDIDKLTLLKSCQLYNGKLTQLNTSANKALEFLGLGYNQVTSLDFSNNPNLKEVRLRHNQLTELDISNNPDLEFFWVDGNEIATVDFSKNPNLKVILARENAISSVDFSNNLRLERVDVSSNNIPTVDISLNVNLTEINFGFNLLNTIDLTQNINLLRIDLYGNQLTTVDLSKNLKLRDLYINFNQLTAIDLSVNPRVERLIIGNNDLNVLDLTANPKIFDLEVNSNQLTAGQLDQIISHIHTNAISNSTRNGYIAYGGNPGTSEINASTISKLNQLSSYYSWSINNW